MRALFILLALVLSQQARAQSAQQSADAAATNAGVSNGVSSQSQANTWVFPAPVQPGGVAATKCTNGGVESAAVLWNLVSWSTPRHEVVLGCQVAADVDMLVRLCQFGAAAKLQAHYLKAQYGIVVAPHAESVDQSPKECFRAPAPQPMPEPPRAAPTPPVPAAAPAPAAPASAPPPLELPTKPAAMAQPFDVVVLFAFDRAGLDGNARAALDLVVRYVAAVPASRLVLTVGHADKVGAAGHNLALSKRRAEAVSAYLLAAGVPPGLMRIEYRGDTDPVSRRNELNRRATVRVE